MFWSLDSVVKNLESKIRDLEHENFVLQGRNYMLEEIHRGQSESNRKKDCFELAVKSGARKDTALELAQKLHQWIFGESK